MNKFLPYPDTHTPLFDYNSDLSVFLTPAWESRKQSADTLHASLSSGVTVHGCTLASSSRRTMRRVLSGLLTLSSLLFSFFSLPALAAPTDGENPCWACLKAYTHLSDFTSDLQSLPPRPSTCLLYPVSCRILNGHCIFMQDTSRLTQKLQSCRLMQ